MTVALVLLWVLCTTFLGLMLIPTDTLSAVAPVIAECLLISRAAIGCLQAIHLKSLIKTLFRSSRLRINSFLQLNT